MQFLHHLTHFDCKHWMVFIPLKLQCNTTCSLDSFLYNSQDPAQEYSTSQDINNNPNFENIYKEKKGNTPLPTSRFLYLLTSGDNETLGWLIPFSSYILIHVHKIPGNNPRPQAEARCINICWSGFFLFAFMFVKYLELFQKCNLHISYKLLNILRIYSGYWEDQNNWHWHKSISITVINMNLLLWQHLHQILTLHIQNIEFFVDLLLLSS